MDGGKEGRGVEGIAYGEEGEEAPEGRFKSCFVDQAERAGNIGVDPTSRCRGVSSARPDSSLRGSLRPARTTPLSAHPGIFSLLSFFPSPLLPISRAEL